MTTNTISPGTVAGISNDISNHAESFQQALGSSTTTHPSLSGAHVITAVIGNHGGVAPKLSEPSLHTPYPSVITAVTPHNTTSTTLPSLSEPALGSNPVSVITAVTPHNTTSTILPTLSEPTLNTGLISVITAVTQENHIKNSEV